jgi:hypothetical protein
MGTNNQTEPAVNPTELYESFLRIMRFERGLWEVTHELFLKNPSNYFTAGVSKRDLLNLTARNVFWYLEHSCCLTVQMGISSLLLDEVYFDKKQTKANLVLRRVIDELVPEGTPERQSIEPDYAKAISLAEGLNESRDKLLAHNDLEWNLAVMKHDWAGSPYPGNLLTVGDLEEIMGCLFRITDKIVSYRHPETNWHWEKLEIEQFFSILHKGRFPQPVAEPEKVTAK